MPGFSASRVNASSKSTWPKSADESRSRDDERRKREDDRLMGEYIAGFIQSSNEYIAGKTMVSTSETLYLCTTLERFASSIILRPGQIGEKGQLEWENRPELAETLLKLVRCTDAKEMRFLGLTDLKGDATGKEAFQRILLLRRRAKQREVSGWEALDDVLRWLPWRPEPSSQPA